MKLRWNQDKTKMKPKSNQDETRWNRDESKIKPKWNQDETKKKPRFKKSK